MACFVVPAAEAVIATVAVQIAKKHEISQEKLECKLPEGAVQAPEYKISVSRKLSLASQFTLGRCFTSCL